MRSINKRRLCLAGVLVVATSLTGCNEPNGQSAAPAGDASQAASVGTAAVASPLKAFTQEQQMKALATCNIERVDDVVLGSGQVDLASGRAHRISGWVAAPGLDNPTYWLRFVGDSGNHGFEIQLSAIDERSDVAALIGKDGMHSGFQAEIPSDALPAGKYHVYLAVITGTNAYSCDNGRKIAFAN